MASVIILHLLLLFFSLTTGQGPLPPNTPILPLRYPTTPWVYPGDTLLMSTTQPLPVLSTGELNPNLTYLLLLVDLDVVLGSTSTVILHWYQPNMVAVHQHPYQFQHQHAQTQTRLPQAPGENYPLDKDTILVNTTAGAQYIAPQPPPNSHHRYVFLLFEQDHGYEFPTCFDYIFPPVLEARKGFDVRQFIEVAGLRPPVAGNYFVVEYDGPLTTSTTAANGEAPAGSRASPTTTWLRSAPCSEEETASPSPNPREPNGFGRHVR